MMVILTFVATMSGVIVTVGLLYQVATVVAEIRERLDWERDYWRQKERQVIATAIEAATVKPATPERIEDVRAAVVVAADKKHARQTEDFTAC